MEFSMAISSYDLRDLIHRLIDANEKFSALEAPSHDFGSGDHLNRTEVHTITAIGNTTGVNVTSLAEQLEISISAASQIIRKLSKMNLVEKYRGPDNNKEVLLRLTPRGKIVYHTHEQFHAKIDEQLMEMIGPISNEEFENLKKITNAIEKTAEKFHVP
jgi:DNA-binding MarR family transcriptional regulator